MNLLRCIRSLKRDPLIVTVLPDANLLSEQELLDAAVTLEWRRRVAENVREKAPARQREMESKRVHYRAQQALRYYRQAS